MVGSMVASCLVGLRHIDTHLQTTRPQVAHCTMDWVVCFGYAPWRRVISMESMLVIWVNLIESFRVIFWYLLTTQMGWNRHLGERILSMPCMSFNEKHNRRPKQKKHQKTTLFFWPQVAICQVAGLQMYLMLALRPLSREILGKLCVCVGVLKDAPNQVLLGPL